MEEGGLELELVQVAEEALLAIRSEIVVLAEEVQVLSACSMVLLVLFRGILVFAFELILSRCGFRELRQHSS